MFGVRVVGMAMAIALAFIATVNECQEIKRSSTHHSRNTSKTRKGQYLSRHKSMIQKLPYSNKTESNSRLEQGHLETPFLKRQAGSPDVDDIDEQYLYNVYDNLGTDNFDLKNTEESPSERQLIMDPNVVDTMRAPHPYPFQPLHLRWPPQIQSVEIIPSPIPVHHFKPVPMAVRVPKYERVPQPYYVPYKAEPDYDVTHVHVYHPENPCRNGGFPVESRFGYHCLCSKDYHGRFCDAKLYCTSSPCQNQGVCEEIENNYRCQCETGYMGYNCEEKDACKPNPCKNDGDCVEISSGFKCYCRPGFTSKICQDLDYCDPNPCQNGGTCEQRHGYHHCICHEQFKGKLCDKRRICLSNPCKNGGKCVEDDPRYPCICPRGYSPPHCRVHVCASNPCLNGGKCEPKKQGYFWSYRCICSYLYKGDKCETPNPCVTQPCLNGGTCIDTFSQYSGFPRDWDMGYLHYYCVCPSGYSGEKCEDNLCSKCDGNASCIQGRCVCKEGYRGNGFRCEAIKNPCTPNPCLNNGTCSNGPDGSFDCTCPKGYFPPLCTKPPNPCISNPCLNNGICVSDNPYSYRCICPAGFLPPDCRNKTVDPCVPNPCENGASCKPTEDRKSFVCNCKGRFKPPLCTCDCPKGDPSWRPPILPQKCKENGACYCPSYNGKTYTMIANGCEEARQEPCASNPCQNGGKCIASADKTSFFCQCPEECTGKLCENCNPDLICKPGYCKNGGTCIVVGTKPFCKCQPGYLPPNCTKAPGKRRNPCHPNPCQNDGICKVTGLNLYECTCRKQFDGQHCERDKCLDCDVHAICYDGDCKCMMGFQGSGLKGDCKEKSVCKSCPLYAVCVDGECTCVKGFYFIKNTCKRI